MRAALIAIAVIVIIIVVIVRRFRGEPVDARDLAVPPVILLALSAKELWGFTHWTSANIIFLAASIIVGIGFGMLRGASTTLFARDGTLHQKYTAKTLIVWALSLAAGLGLHFGAHAIGAEEAVRPMTLSIGLSLLGEAITCGWRGLRSGIPFSQRPSGGQKDSQSRVDDLSSQLSQLLDRERRR